MEIIEPVQYVRPKRIQSSLMVPEFESGFDLCRKSSELCFVREGYLLRCTSCGTMVFEEPAVRCGGALIGCGWHRAKTLDEAGFRELFVAALYHCVTMVNSERLAEELGLNYGIPNRVVVDVSISPEGPIIPAFEDLRPFWALHVGAEDGVARYHFAYRADKLLTMPPWSMVDGLAEARETEEADEWNTVPYMPPQ